MMSMASNEKQSQQAPAVAAQRRTAAARGAVAGPIAQLAGEINASPRVQSLTQLQQNIDRGPHIQRQLDMSSDFSVLPRGDRSFDASHGSAGLAAKPSGASSDACGCDAETKAPEPVRAKPKEEKLQAKPKEEKIQGKPKEEKLQAKPKEGKLQAKPKEEKIQGKAKDELHQRRAEDASSSPSPEAATSSGSGLPPQLKSGVESLSGMSMDHVQVHYNSTKPAQLSALAYAQGSDIHVGPGQEQHLPHEAWHVVQQAQGRVQPTTQMKDGIAVNNDPALEHEADAMGAKARATQLKAPEAHLPRPQPQPVQRKVGFEAELSVPSLGKPAKKLKYFKNEDGPNPTSAIRSFLDGGVPYDTNIGEDDMVRVTADHSSKVSRLAIVEKLKELGYVTGDPDEFRTNLEFVTPAHDELATGSTKTFAASNLNLKDQMSGALESAKSGELKQLAAPAEADYKTGVPVEDLKAWVGEEDYKELEPLIETFINEQIADSINLQATVGIIPSGIRAFLARNMQAGSVEIEPPSEARQNVLGVVTEVVTQLESYAPFAEHEWVSTLDSTSREALLGISSLAFSYLLGDVLQQTTGGTESTVKNAVPFLIKSGTKNLTAQGGPHMLKSNPVPEEVAHIIAVYFNESKYLKTTYWTGKSKTSAKHEGLLNERVKARPGSDKLITTGDYVSFVERMLTNLDRVASAVVGKKQLEGADKLPKKTGDVKVAWESYGQGGIPLEYRWIKNRYTVGSVVAAMKEIVNDVRLANMKELTEEQKKDVKEALKS